MLKTLIGRLDNVVSRWHIEIRSRAAIEWPYVWVLSSFREYIWLFIYSISASLIFLQFLAAIATIHVLTKSDNESLLDQIVSLNVMTVIIGFLIFIRFSSIYNENELKARHDPLLRSVPALHKNNSSVIIYTLMTVCLLPLLFVGAVDGYIMVSQFYNAAVATAGIATSIYSVLIVRKSRNIGRHFSVDFIMKLVGFGGFILFFTMVLIWGGAYVLSALLVALGEMFPSLIRSGHISASADAWLAVVVLNIGEVLRIIFPTIIGVTLIGIFARCMYMAYNLIVRPKINRAGLEQIDSTMSLVFTCNAIILLWLLISFDGGQCLIFLLASIILNCIPALISDLTLRRISLEPIEIESWSWRML